MSEVWTNIIGNDPYPQKDWDAKFVNSHGNRFHVRIQMSRQMRDNMVVKMKKMGFSEIEIVEEVN